MAGEHFPATAARSNISSPDSGETLFLKIRNIFQPSIPSQYVASLLIKLRSRDKIIELFSSIWKVLFGSFEREEIRGASFRNNF